MSFLDALVVNLNRKELDCLAKKHDLLSQPWDHFNFMDLIHLLRVPETAHII